MVWLLGTKVDPAKNEVSLKQAGSGEGQALRCPQQTSQNICTRRDTHDRATVFDLLPSDWGHLYTIGRLDANSEGLILLTNDGDFCQKVAHPGTACSRPTVPLPRVNTEALKTLTNGLRDDGEWLQAKSAKHTANNTRSEVELVLAEGKTGRSAGCSKRRPSGVAVEAHAVGPETGRATARQMARPSQAEIASCLRFGGKAQESHRRN